jgi:hypothetical protein
VRKGTKAQYIVIVEIEKHNGLRNGMQTVR